MVITISTQDLLQVVAHTPATQNIMLAGKHGIGKSKILTDYFEQQGQRVVTLFLGQMSDPGDLIGLPRKNEQSGKTEFMPPYWFPTDGKPIVLFLDELNRARPEILQTIMDLALNRRLAGRPLPEGSRIISAVNDGDEYQLTDLDPALISRFNIYTFVPTTADWLIWAEKHGIDPRIIKFIQSNESMLDSTINNDGSSSLEKSPDRRAWERVSHIIKDVKNIDTIFSKIIAGIVGSKATAAFMASIANDDIISAKELLASFDAVQEILNRYEVHQLSILNERVYRHLETAKSVKPKEGVSLKKYIEWLSNSRREAMAHFCSLYEKNNYSKANVFMMINTPECFKIITSFLKSI
ncbi:MAG: AAA family ATPase [Alistipes sp.]|nr:AAA family ATPase [Alistipes sp.]